MNVGARYAYNPIWIPAQCGRRGNLRGAPCLTSDINFSTFSGVDPRLSFALRRHREGQTVLKAGWGRFDSKRTFNQMNQADPFAT